MQNSKPRRPDRRRFACVIALVGCSNTLPPTRTENHPTTPAAPPPIASAAATPLASPSSATSEGPLSPDVEPYRETAAEIARQSLANDAAYEKLTYLSDAIGARLSGSLALERAVEWARQTFVKEGHEQVALEAVEVPHWVRGTESAELLGDVPRNLHPLTLGGSVATPPSGITAELLVVHSFDELEQHKLEVKGKIVLFDHAMRCDGNPAQNYGEALPYRSTAALRAAPYGAVAVLTRSLTCQPLSGAHTGSLRYDAPPARKIPAAALSIAESELLSRLAARQQRLRVKLTLQPKTLPDAHSANVIAELRGREKPEEIVLLGAHLDSWDVGQGAQDDGAGVVTVMQALTTLRGLAVRPRRTIRAVLFTNEENGARGAKRYAENHQAELARHVAAFEMDIGAGAPLGFFTDGEQPFQSDVAEIARLLTPLGSSSILPGYPGEDIVPLRAASVPLFGVWLDPSHYFDVHHSAADTLEQVSGENLRKSVATLATLAYVIADRKGTLRTGTAP